VAFPKSRNRPIRLGEGAIGFRAKQIQKIGHYRSVPVQIRVTVAISDRMSRLSNPNLAPEYRPATKLL
jgi:hypothetical protein